VFPGLPGLPAPLYRRGRIAVRVDADPCVRLLCRLSCGLLVSSSLNRPGKPPAWPDRRLRFRWRRHLDGRLETHAVRPTGRASKVLALKGERLHPIRA